jgi:hypothetical protein
MQRCIHVEVNALTLSWLETWSFKSPRNSEDRKRTLKPYPIHLARKQGRDREGSKGCGTTNPILLFARHQLGGLAAVSPGDVMVGRVC